MPYWSPWETMGGTAELHFATFLRGARLSSFGLTETCLTEISVRASRIETYHEMQKSIPWKTDDRLKFLRKIFSADGDLKEFSELGLKVVDGYSNFRSERNAWAHGHLVILPCTAPQRWENAWITLKHYDPKKGSFNQNNLRILASDLVDFTKSAKQIADNAIELRSKVDQRLPQL